MTYTTNKKTNIRTSANAQPRVQVSDEAGNRSLDEWDNVRAEAFKRASALLRAVLSVLLITYVGWVMCSALKPPIIVGKDSISKSFWIGWAALQFFLPLIGAIVYTIVMKRQVDPLVSRLHRLQQGDN